VNQPSMTIRVLITLLISLALHSMSAAANPAGYLLATFSGPKSSPEEQIYFEISGDGRKWKALNEGKPVLVSDIGEKGVRDPFLIRSPDGKRIFLIATDLATHLKPGWKRAVTVGSQSIVVWESTDLVTWSAPRLIKVAPADAGCTWAPEASYDEKAGDYLVYWASATRRDNFAKQRIWAARTKDFINFGEPFIYIEREHSVIDTTIVRDGSRYYRFSKHEDNRAIFLETSESLLGKWTDIPGFLLQNERGYEGPACFALNPASEGGAKTWVLFLDYYAKGIGYTGFVTHDIASGKFVPDAGFSFPFKTPHGSILSISMDEAARLKSTYGVEE